MIVNHTPWLKATDSEDRDPIGVKWATTWIIAMSTWPAYARPVPPVGDPALKAVAWPRCLGGKNPGENGGKMGIGWDEIMDSMAKNME